MRLALLVGVGTGVLIAVQSAILGPFGTRVPPFVAATWVHVGGLLFAVTVLLLTRTDPGFAAVRGAPWGLLAGVAGVLLVAGITFTVGGLGLAAGSLLFDLHAVLGVYAVVARGPGA